VRDFSLNLPVNSVSFGQVSVALLREFHARGLQPSIFPIGDSIDLACQDTVGEDFQKWIQSCVAKRLEEHNRSNPIFKLWHLSGLYLVGKKNKISNNVCLEIKIDIIIYIN